MKTAKFTALALSVLLCFSACADGSDSVSNPAAGTTSGETGNPDKTTSSDIQPSDTSDKTTPAPVVKENIDFAAFDGEIEETAASLGVVGMGVSVFAEGEVIYTTSYGYADREAGISADSDTLYRAASVSKMISSLVLMTLYDNGVITPYSELEAVTGFPYNNPALDEPVLLWHLLTHTAGIVDTYVYDDSPIDKPSLDYVLSASYNGYAPGTYYIYSNFGAGTIGGIVERLTGEFFHDYADRALFQPLGMDAGYCIDLIGSRDNAANLYNYGDLQFSPKSWGRTTAYYESYGLGNSYLSAQCELLITTADLARLGILLAGDGSVDGISILSKDAVNAMNATYYTDDDLEFDMGLCVRKYNENLVSGRMIHGHPGLAYGSVNGLFYDPSDGTGVAICSIGSPPSVNEDNGVYELLNECVNIVYDTFFG